jgi:lysophospholipase L1-like esterase
MKTQENNKMVFPKLFGSVVVLLLASITLVSFKTNVKTTTKSIASPYYHLIGADNSNIKYVGRIDMSSPAAPKFSNPGVYFKAKFRGEHIAIDMEDETNLNYIAIVIDNASPVRLLIEKGRKTYTVATGLTKGDHTILICKETESGVGSLIFYGFRCAGLAEVTDMTSRKIECYGNSITCGAKMLLGIPCDLTNNNTNWNAANSAYLSYGALTARSLNAQWQLTSVSGIGLIHSCCNMRNTMPMVYDRLSLNDATSPKWDFSRYTPDVVTICLGENDGSPAVASQEFKTTYVAFIKTIRGKYPQASVFCLTSPMADSSSSSTCLFKVMKETLASVVDSLNKAGDSKVYWVALPHDMNNGCPKQGHPGEAEHRQTAVVLEAAIKAKMGW